MASTDREKLEALYAELGETPPPASAQPRPSPVAQPIAQDSIPDLSTARILGQYFPDLGELTGTLAGAATGAKAGRVLGVPGMAVGMAVGAATGRGVGETTKQLIEGSSDPIKAIDDALTSGAFALGFEAIGPVFGMAKDAISKVRTNKSLSDAELQSISELQRRLEAVGITLTPAQLTRSGFQQNLEKIAISGFGGEAPFKNLYQAQEKFIANTLQEIVKRTGRSDRKLTGAQFQDALQTAEDQLIAWAKPKYAEIDQLGRNTPINIQSTEQTLKNTIARGKMGRKKGSTLDPKVEDMYQFVLNTKRNTDFKTIFDTISRLSSDLRNAKANIANPNKTYEKALRDTIELLHNDLDKAALNSGNEELLKKYRDVSEIYRESMRTLDDSAISGLATQSPEFVGQMIYNTGNVTAVEKAFGAIDEAYQIALRAGKKGDDLPNVDALKNNIRSGYLENLFKKVQTNDTSVETAFNLLKQLENDPVVRDTFKAILTPKQIFDVKQTLGWAKDLEQLSAGNFSLIVRGRQSGAVNQVINAASGAGLAAGYAIADPLVLGTAMAMVVSPSWLAKRAVGGKVTSKMLDQLKGYALKFNEGKMTKSDVATFFGIMAKTALPDESSPQEFAMPGLTAEEVYRMQELRTQLPD